MYKVYRVFTTEYEQIVKPNCSFDNEEQAYEHAITLLEKIMSEEYNSIDCDAYHTDTLSYSEIWNLRHKNSDIQKVICSDKNVYERFNDLISVQLHYDGNFGIVADSVKVEKINM